MIKFTRYYLGRPKVVEFLETREELKIKIEEAGSGNNIVDYKYEIVDYKYEIDAAGEKKNVLV